MDTSNKKKLIQQTSKLKVLYVEDDDSIRGVTENFLNKIFLKVTIAKNGKDGLEKFKTDTFDIIISDIRMPSMDGIEMSKYIKEITPSIPIILISAFNEIEYFKRAIDANIDLFLEKPLNIKKFLESLDKIIYNIIVEKENIEYKIHIENLNKKLAKEASFEQQLRKSIFDNNNSIIVINKDNELLDANKSFFEFFDQYDKLEKFKNKHKCICEFFEEYNETYITSYKDGKYWIEYIKDNEDSLNKVVMKKNDKLEHFLINFHEIELDNNIYNIIEFVNITTDIEYQNKIEKIRTEFLTIFTHELKTPLHAITNYSAHLKRQILKDKFNKEKFTGILTLLENNADSMLDEVEAILNIGRLKSKSININSSKIDIQRIIDDVLENFSSNIDDKNIEIEYDPIGAVVYSDKKLMKNLFKNIISNAVKYCKDKIYISINNKNDSIIITVEDNGSGIENTENIFDLFTIEEKVENKTETGTGIGLYFVKLICENLSIIYEVTKSDKLGGAKFIFKIRKKGIEDD